MPFLAAAVLMGLLAAGAGLARMGWALAPPFAERVAQHGPLMVGGFFGLLISVERAVGHGSRRAFAVPLLAAAGSAVLVEGDAEGLATLLLAGASAGLLGIYASLYRRRPDRPLGVMAAGAGLWLVSNVAWAAGLPAHRLVPAWAGFLILTIAGERLELAGLRPVSGLAGRLRSAWFGVAAAGMAAGGLLAIETPAVGVGVTGAGMVLLGLWLVSYDVVRRTLRLGGLPRYMALCLLPGYAWLVGGGGMWLMWPERFGAGLLYDAMVHAPMVGFVLSMVFGHAPVILPGVAGGGLRFSRVLYLPLVLMHLSTAVRVAGDLAAFVPARQWGGLVNAASLMLFFLLMLAGQARGRLHGRAAIPGP